MISKSHLKDKVVKEIISLIAQRVYQHGQRLPAERLLSEQFHVSRGTLRDGLAKLEDLGVLEIRPGSGTYVKELSMKEIPHDLVPRDYSRVSLRDIIAARKAIELPSIALACENHTQRDIQKLGRLIEQMKKHSADLSEHMKYDMGFHRTIIQTSKNKVLLVAFDAIQEFHTYSQIFVMEAAIHHHEGILESMRDGDAKQAQRRLAAHLDDMDGYLHLSDRKGRKK